MAPACCFLAFPSQLHKPRRENHVCAGLSDELGQSDLLITCKPTECCNPRMDVAIRD
jgi:hypothetical protein